MTETEKKIANRCDEIQNDLHNIINHIYEQLPNDEVNYQDYVNSYLINRIATLEIALEERVE